VTANCQRNNFEDDNCRLRPVDDFASFTGFSCACRDLDDYIQNDAERHDREMISRTYAFHLKDQGSLSPVVAFVSLANDAIRLANRKKERLFPDGLRYKAYPAVKVCRLGTRAAYQRQGIGSYVLWTLRFLFLSDNRTGCRFMTVDAYNDPPTLNFYQKNDFALLSENDAKEDTRSMYCDLLRFREQASAQCRSDTGN